ncbi:MAG: hypothetical protein QXD13_02085 [Candidatus Pacearchaeota archaeon]
MEIAYAIILPDRLNVLDDSKLRAAYASAPKRGVTFAQSDRKALSNFLYSSFKNKDIPKLILHKLKESIKKRDESLNGLDSLLEQGAQAYDIPEIEAKDGSYIPPSEEEFHRTMILAESIANARNEDLNACSAEKFRAYKHEAGRFVKEAMMIETRRKFKKANSDRY